MVPVKDIEVKEDKISIQSQYKNALDIINLENKKLDLNLKSLLNKAKRAPLSCVKNIEAADLYLRIYLYILDIH